MTLKATRSHLPTVTQTGSGLSITAESSRLASAIVLLLVLAVLFWISPLYAQADDLEQAQNYMKDQEFDKAYDTLYELFRQDPGNPEINFLLGRAAFENKDYESAIMAFERILIVRPEADRVKLEMARCLYNLGSVETARQYFEEVLAKDPPKNVRDNIQRYLRSIRATRKEHFLTGRITLGVDFDDNANVAPSSTEIDISTTLGDVIPITVDGPEKDQIYNSTLNFNYIYKPLHSPLAWKVSGVNYNAVYRDVKDLDVNLFDLKAGLCLQGNRITWELYGLANQLNLDYDQYQRSYGGGAGLSIVLRPYLMVSMNGKYRKKDYIDEDDRDARNISISLGPVLSLGRNRISATVGWENDKAREDVNTYNRGNAIVTYDRQLPFGLSCALAYWYQKTDYDEENVLFNKKRSDNVQYFITSLSKSIWHSRSWETALQVNAGYTYTRSDSNIALYEYTKNVLSTSLSFVF